LGGWRNPSPSSLSSLGNSATTYSMPIVVRRGIMDNFHLEPADILVNINDRNDPYSVVKRWLVGPYDHVFMFMGKVGLLVNLRQSRILRVPMLFESNGRGVVLQALSNRYSEKVVVMRLKSEHDRRRIPRVLEEAIKLASDTRSFYDYYCIPRFIFIRLFCNKLGIPLMLKYQRDALMICSEAVAECFWRAKLEILPKNLVPLPGDFVGNPLLDKVWGGVLTE